MRADRGRYRESATLKRPNTSLPTLKQVLERKNKERRWSRNNNKGKHGNDTAQELFTTLKSREEGQTHQCPPKRKNIWDKFQTRKIVAKPKPKTDFTSYLVDVVWDGSLWYNCTNLIGDCSHSRSLIGWGKTGKKIFDIKTGNGIIMHMVKESFVACLHSKDNVKQTKTTGQWQMCTKFTVLFSLVSSKTDGNESKRRKCARHARPQTSFSWFLFSTNFVCCKFVDFTETYDKKWGQAWAELCQTQVKLGLAMLD